MPHEETITIGPRDREGEVARFFNLPTIVDKKRVSPERATQLFDSGLLRPFGMYSTLEQAIQAARERSWEAPPNPSRPYRGGPGEDLLYRGEVPTKDRGLLQEAKGSLPAYYDQLVRGGLLSALNPAGTIVGPTTTAGKQAIRALHKFAPDLLDALRNMPRKIRFRQSDDPSLMMDVARYVESSNQMPRVLKKGIDEIQLAPDTLRGRLPEGLPLTKKGGTFPSVVAHESIHALDDVAKFTELIQQNPGLTKLINRAQSTPSVGRTPNAFAGGGFWEAQEALAQLLERRAQLRASPKLTSSSYIRGSQAPGVITGKESIVEQAADQIYQLLMQTLGRTSR